MAKQTFDLTDENVSPVKVILQLTWPLFLEQILSTLVSFADTAMVGALGVNATAAVSISNTFVFLFNAVMLALGTGITAYVAKSIGGKDYESAKGYIRHAIMLLLMVGLPIGILTCALHRQIPRWMGAEDVIMDDAAAYLLITSAFRVFNMAIMVLGGVYRGIGDTKTPLYVNTAVNVLNIIGNYLLINQTHAVSLFGLTLVVPGAGWGVVGAAASTAGSWLLGGTVLAVLLFIRKTPTRISLRDDFRVERQKLRNIINLSVPVMLERMCMSGAAVVVSRTVATLGTVTVAANSIFSTAESISFMPAFAFATAATTLMGQSLGAGKPDLAKKYIRLTQIINILIMTAAGIALYVFARPIVMLITRDEEAVQLSMKCLRIAAFVQPIQSVMWTDAGALRGAGDTKWPFYIGAVGNWGFRALGSVLCVLVFHLGLPSVTLMMCVDNTVRCILMRRRFLREKWRE